MKRIFLTAAFSIALAAAGSAQQRQALTPEQRQQKLAEARQLLQQRQEKLAELQQQLQEFEVQLQQQQQQSRQLQRETQHLQTRHRQYHCGTGLILPTNRTVQNVAVTTTANAPPAVGAELRQQTREVQIQVTRHSQSLSDIGGLLANLKGASGGISVSGNPLGTNVASLSDLGMTQQEQQQVLTIQHQLQQQNQQNMVFQQQIQQESLRYQTLGHAQRGMHDIIAQMLSNLK